MQKGNDMVIDKLTLFQYRTNSTSTGCLQSFDINGNELEERYASDNEILALLNDKQYSIWFIEVREDSEVVFHLERKK